ncbi:MAG TPA: 16S rRNA (cytidine(1402)-2'-O)-methyltransferase [Clostridiaceae bacterium]|jgi:16S rRNA (cytidine1402-2'-O)-methyltransferase|nr:16S rRNA (cytidine(1402)-2'-O)-methyltransferase [Clostridiaceae bacterium]
MSEKYGTLYMVATPIGNLEDITYRAVRILSEVDLIAAEDTRHSLRLLNHLGIKKPLISYHDNNRISRAEELVSKLKNGQNIALISDAGMPGISDPGEELVALAVSQGIVVTAVPGCSASLTALVLSGLPSGRFAFEGFLPQKRNDRVKFLESIKYEDRTIIFYEGPHRIRKTLEDILKVFGDRRCSILRELTKLHEEAIRGTVSDVVSHFEDKEPRGEFVIVVEGSKEKASDNPKPDLLCLTVEDHVKYYMTEGYERMDAMKLAAKDRGLSKRDIYKLLNS